MKKDPFDLEDRLLEYSVGVIRLVESLPDTRAANHVGGQLLRCGTSPLFNHGEAQAAESAADFVHKLKICLKELRESKRALRLIRAVPLSDDTAEIDRLLAETLELIRIFFASLKTAASNKSRTAGKAPRAHPLNVESSTLNVESSRGRRPAADAPTENVQRSTSNVEHSTEEPKSDAP